MNKKVYIFLVFFLFTCRLLSQTPTDPVRVQSTPKSDAFLQGFYWNSTPGGIWWDSLAKLSPALASSGFSAVWVPAPTKGAAGTYSMGYDIYDHYDFGEFDQKGSIETRFGSRQELTHMINTFHNNGMQVFADAVMGHMNGADQKVPYDCKPYPTYPDSGWLVFNYQYGSGRFLKDATFFYPNQQTCDVNPPYHGPTDPIYKFGEILAHAQSKVKDSLIVWGKYLRQVLGFDGFRIDEVKSIDPIFVGPWLQEANAGGFAVAEDYDGLSGIQDWLYWCKYFGGTVSMFDFPLRFDLKEMCNNTSGGYNMTWLDGAGLINNGTSGYDVVTFVENHDVDRAGYDGSIDNPAAHNPIIYNKDMAYAYTLFSEGRPCVWFRDYYIYGLHGKIDTLLWIRQNFLWGGTTKRSGLNPWYVGGSGTQDEQATDIYVARRNGGDGRPAAYLVINDNSSGWRGVWVYTDYPNQVFRDFTGVAIDKQSAIDGRVELWAPPRGYVIYVPDTTLHINHPPYIVDISDQIAFINTLFEYQTDYGDPNNDSLAFSLSGNPSWLSVSTSGKLIGTSAESDVATFTVTLNVIDPHGDTASTTFMLNVLNHPLIDGTFEGTGIWGQALLVADTLAGWDSTSVKEIYVTQDQNYFYLGAKVKTRQWMNWAFAINTKLGGGSTDSWGRSILYNHTNKPDYVFRGSFSGSAQFHTWNGSSWSGVGTSLNSTEYAENINSDISSDGWVEGRVLKSAMGSASLLGIQMYVTGNQNSQATFDACPNDQNTTAWSGVTTRLNYYAYYGQKQITNCNLQYPQSAQITIGNFITAYARAYGMGITDSAGKGSGLLAWFGYNTLNTNPSTWASWIPATYNLDINGYDEYKLDLGASLPDGIYYFTSRFQFSGGEYVFGGYSTNGGGIWDSVHNTSGYMRIYGPPLTPTLSAPTDSNEHQPSTPILSWSAVSNAQTYRLQVSEDSSFNSTFFDDSSIVTSSKQVGPLSNNTKYFWRVRSKNIAGISAYSAAWSFTVTQTTSAYRFDPAWNMISLPMRLYDNTKEHLFPTSISSAFSYSQDFGYVSEESLKVGVGYWLKFALGEDIPFTGFITEVETIEVKAGWNMIGSISDVILATTILQIPEGNIISPFYTYRGGYQFADTIKPAKAYWVKTDTAGKIVMKDSNIGKTIASKNINCAIEEYSKLIIEDAAHHRQVLYFGKRDNEDSNDDSFGLPPIPPSGIFDVRYASERNVELISHGQTGDFQIRLSSVEYPARLRCQVSAPSMKVNIKIEGRTIPIGSIGCLELTSPPSSIILAISDGDQLPTRFSLYQNYPNPFNPTTSIKYELPFSNHVVIKIYDLIGRELETLVDELKEPGVYNTEWDGNKYPNGMYFYRLRSGTYTESRKMILMK